MAAVGGLLLALICFGTVGLAAGIALATFNGREPHWLLPAVRAIALLLAAACFFLACLHQLADTLASLT